MDPNTLNLIKGAAGAGDEKIKYVEQVFSTFLYRGNDTAGRNIENGIDLAGEEGGLVWIKNRDSNSDSFILTDTVRGANKFIISDDINVEDTDDTDKLTAFNSNGFTLGDAGPVNGGGNNDYVSWTFRRAPGFFDIVTYEGNYDANDGGSPQDQTINHNLGCTPACIMIKCLDQNENWCVYHKDMGADPKQEAMFLNLDDDADGGDWWNSTLPTSTQFTVGAKDETNKDGKNYIAYLFADGTESAAQIWGDNEDESIIRCGSFSTDNSQNATITGLGWEPQWVLFKCHTNDGYWRCHDSTRHMGLSGYAVLHPNNVVGESTSTNTPVIASKADGFEIQNTNANRTYIYIAIRSAPMKTPTSATDVFAMDYGSGAPKPPTWDAPFVPDAAFFANPSEASSLNVHMSTRQMGTRVVLTNTSDYWLTQNGDYSWDGSQTATAASNGLVSGWGEDKTSEQLSWMFKKAPGFFDTVLYKGTGSAHNEPHNLGVAPEFMIVKCLDNAQNWAVYHKDLTSASYHLRLNSNSDELLSASIWNNTAPDEDVFAVGANDESNKTGEWFQALLFRTLAGISKVGSYSGTGNNLDIDDCGFSGSARLVLIKRTNQVAGGVAGDWYFWDSVRGINSSDNDPYILLNNTDAQVNNEDRIEPLTGGFRLTNFSGTNANYVNASGGEYIYLAIA